MEIVRKFLSATNIDPPGVRYVVDTDTVQTFVDGAWVDTPAADPRSAASGLLPPRTTSDPKCDAAANMSAKIKSVVDYYISVAEQALFVSGAAGIILAFFPPFALIYEVLWALADFLVGLGVVAVTSAMTSDVYDHLECFFYEQLDDDGQLDAAGLTAFLSTVAAQESSTVYDIVSAICSSLGWVGIDNAGATGEEIGDCDACVPIVLVCPNYGTILNIGTGRWQLTSENTGGGNQTANVSREDGFPAHLHICFVMSDPDFTSGTANYSDYLDCANNPIVGNPIGVSIEAAFFQNQFGVPFVLEFTAV